MVVDVGSTTYEVIATAFTATVVMASLTVYLSEMTCVTVIRVCNAPPESTSLSKNADTNGLVDTFDLIRSAVTGTNIGTVK